MYCFALKLVFLSFSFFLFEVKLVLISQNGPQQIKRSFYFYSDYIKLCVW